MKLHPLRVYRVDLAGRTWLYQREARWVLGRTVDIDTVAFLDPALDGTLALMGYVEVAEREPRGAELIDAELNVLGRKRPGARVRIQGAGWMRLG
jgi:hypothetical protein